MLRASEHAVFLALLAIDACIAYDWCMQYTIRGIPPVIDDALRARERAARV